MICADCGAPTNMGSQDGVFRCWKCHCRWESSSASSRCCSTVPSLSRGLASGDRQGIVAGGSNERAEGEGGDQ